MRLVLSLPCRMLSHVLERRSCLPGGPTTRLGLACSTAVCFWTLNRLHGWPLPCMQPCLVLIMGRPVYTMQCSFTCMHLHAIAAAYRTMYRSSSSLQSCLGPCAVP